MMDILEILFYTSNADQAVIGAMAAIQLGLGAVGAIRNLVNPAPQPRVASGIVQAQQEARNMKNITQGAGMEQAQAEARQTQADTIGQASLRTDDPNKLLATTAATNLQGLRAGQQRDAVTQQQRLQGQQQFMQASGRLGQEQARVEQANLVQEDQREAVAGNLIGAGVENIATNERDNFMMDAYSKVQKGEDISKLLADRNKLPGQGSGWAKKFLGFLGGGEEGSGVPDLTKLGESLKNFNSRGY